MGLRHLLKMNLFQVRQPPASHRQMKPPYLPMTTQSDVHREEDAMPSSRIVQVSDEAGHSVTFQLNESSSAADLLAQLPLNTEIENYSDDEKVFYSEALYTAGVPLANARVGTMCYLRLTRYGSTLKAAAISFPSQGASFSFLGTVL